MEQLRKKVASLEQAIEAKDRENVQNRHMYDNMKGVSRKIKEVRVKPSPPPRPWSGPAASEVSCAVPTVIFSSRADSYVQWPCGPIFSRHEFQPFSSLGVLKHTFSLETAAFFKQPLLF